MRKTEKVTIDAEGRDKGKVFQVTEMSAVAAEQWAMRAFFALANTGVELPEDIAETGMAGMASVGLQALGKIPYEAAEPLLADMFDCVEIIPDPSKPNVTRKPMDEDFEEVRTRLTLRKAVWDLHTGFFSQGDPLTSASQTSNSES